MIYDWGLGIFDLGFVKFDILKKSYTGKGRKSTRLQSWDYGRDGIYYVTINVKNRQPSFSNRKNKKMLLSDIGQLAHGIWHRIPLKFPFVVVDRFCILPDHLHGILIIKKKSEVPKQVQIPADKAEFEEGGVTGSKNPMLHKNLSTIIRWYKGRVTFEARKIDPNFEWQPRFYESIIRDYQHFENVRAYIQTNQNKHGG